VRSDGTRDTDPVQDAHMFTEKPAQPRSGVTVVLDSRWRLLLPYGIRVHSGPGFGIRLIVLAAPIEGLAATLMRCYRW
jgi:hypothetical protein